MPDEAIERMVRGFRTFKDKNYWGDVSPFETLVREGQKPKVLLIACSDSRVDPAITLGLAPGDVFVIRNVANIIPPYEMDSAQHGASAALEYAITTLKVEHVVVMGHAHCGGIRALVDQPKRMCANSDSFLERWMSLAKPAYESVINEYPDADNAELAHQCEKESVLSSLNNLKTFPWVEQRLKEGSIKLHGWYFNLVNGNLCVYSEADKRFKSV
ncbi:MAG: carbonic anhydrase [Gammaproteobacteria bacterium]|nr:carbonic anhydrase [Gammaproteobacteria bacterium]